MERSFYIRLIKGDVNSIPEKQNVEGGFLDYIIYSPILKSNQII